jgi:glycosyltransferase involved in cell wall biosynthesis
MREKRKQKTVMYVNFSPYENTGNIADYIRSKFKTVILFIFNFHHLGTKQERSRILIYRNGKLIQKLFMFQTTFAPSYALLSLSVRSFVIFIQILYYSVHLYSDYGPYDIFFSVNAFTVWCGNILKNMRIVKKTVFWVWDYYPPVHPNKMISFIRWIYWQFDKAASTANKVIFLNTRLEKLHKHIGIIPKNLSYSIVPIGTNPKISLGYRKQKITLAFLGALKKSQGLDFIFDSSHALIKHFPGIRLNIFGSGPDEQYYKQRAKNIGLPVTFYGYMPDDKKLFFLLSRSGIGIATYVPDKENVSYFGDPSKIKAYLSAGLPVITTNVFAFHKDIAANTVGVIVRYGNQRDLTSAIRSIQNEYSSYRKRVLHLAKKYDYKKQYGSLFSGV